MKTICPVCHAFNCPCAAAAQARDTLDEERLARALAQLNYTSDPNSVALYGPTQEVAAAIAKAYRDDHE